jgi:prepilin-type N-terminal cleavage/methylation domain-containing protein
MPNIKHKEEGFTLIELLVVIAIIGILAAVIFVALDPATRFADARDAVRQNDVQEILSAVKIYQVDEGGDLPVTQDTNSASINAGETYMIGDATSGCDGDNSTPAVSCAAVTDGDNCIDLSAKLVTDGYLGQEPVSPDGQGAWDQNLSGYTYSVDGNGIVTIGACESEGGGTIQAIR